MGRRGRRDEEDAVQTEGKPTRSAEYLAPGISRESSSEVRGSIRDLWPDVDFLWSALAAKSGSYYICAYDYNPTAGQGWHQVAKTGTTAITALGRFQPASGSPRLFYSEGTAIKYFLLPQDALNPYVDTAYRYALTGDVYVWRGDLAPLRRVGLWVERSAQSKAAAALKQGLAVAQGMNLAKDLGNLPPNVCTPAYLADEARQLAKRYRMKVTVLERADMERLGMHTLLSVAQGSARPPKFITLEYRGGPEKMKPVALVGKGITFDTGGISLKPAGEMDEMKFDMCGAASVLGTLKAAGEMRLPVNVVGAIPTTENMPGGRATRPGDIVKSLSGQTVEILNTDAEGRLILCDALTYVERFRPAVVIDIATLTGACVIALGHVATGLFANDEALAREIVTAGDDAYDRVWRMPLWEDYQESLKSNFADFANIGGRPAGAVTAACFLARFTKGYKWAHLDIAGTAWKTGKEKGATGRPVPLLAQFLVNQARGK